MPEIPLKRVVSVSSAEPRFPAENLLRPEGGGRWRAAAGEKQISVVLELPAERPIHSLHIGNDGSAFVEVLVGAAAGGDFQVLLPTAAFMSPSESRVGAEPQRVRLFGPEALVKGVAGRGWDRLRLVCSQPYCQTRPFGLSFIRLFSPPEDDAPPEPPVRRLGPFTLREEGGSPRRPPGALFYQRPPSPTASPQDPPGPSYAVATLQASAGSAPKLPKRRPPPKTNGTPRKRPPPSPTPAGSPPQILGGGGGSPPSPTPPAAGPILAGVVLALSGFQNPQRSQLRDAALALGAGYRPDWTPDCTHLICAFPRTPKAARARALGGLLVGPAWIWDCQRQQRRLPCGP